MRDPRSTECNDPTFERSTGADFSSLLNRGCFNMTSTSSALGEQGSAKSRSEFWAPHYLLTMLHGKRREEQVISTLPASQEGNATAARCDAHHTLAQRWELFARFPNDRDLTPSWAEEWHFAMSHSQPLSISKEAYIRLRKMWVGCWVLGTEKRR